MRIHKKKTFLIIIIIIRRMIDREICRCVKNRDENKKTNVLRARFFFLNIISSSFLYIFFHYFSLASRSRIARHIIFLVRLFE